MKKSNNTFLTACTMLAAVLLLVSMVLQFLPFWGEASVAGYIWFPKYFTGVTETLTAQIEGFDLNQIVLAPTMQLVCGVVGIGFCLVKRGTPLPFVLTGLSGLFGVYGCLHPAFRMGSIWPLFLVMGLLLVLVTIVGLGLWLSEYRDKPHTAYI